MPSVDLRHHRVWCLRAVPASSALSALNIGVVGDERREPPAAKSWGRAQARPQPPENSRKHAIPSPCGPHPLARARWPNALLIAWLLASASAASGQEPELSDAYFGERIAPLIEQYCGDCHAGQEAEAGIRLDRSDSLDKVRQERSIWLKVLGQLQASAMPPSDADQPTAEERELLRVWIDRAVNSVDCSGPVSPGRVTLRRLNRHEYRNTIRDLLGIDYAPAADFPADDVGYGFDHIGDVLSLPTILMEKYLAAAEEISRQALADASSEPQDAQQRLPRRPIILRRPGEEWTPQAAAAANLAPLAAAAFRRPVTDAEVARLAQLVAQAVDDGESFEAGMQLALQAILISPHFLFRVELDPEGDAETRQLNDHELAVRLSYFLWSTMPDAELFDAAREGRLQDLSELEQQVRRMLADPKSQALIENFAGQWLQLRNLDTLTFDPARFPGCDAQLLADMREETLQFFAALVREDQSLLRLLDADFTFVNQRLAAHYGLAGVTGNEFRRVSLQGTPRAGILTHASVLAVTSNPSRTSPVKRGKFVLDNLLGAPPPPAPANVPQLDDANRALTGTLRQRLEQHRADPGCASCHQLMDPIGFALEHFDAVGRYRTTDAGQPIDASGALPSGDQFSGLDELRGLLLAKRRDDVARCLVEKMLVYALGRGLEYYDQCAVNNIRQALEQDDYRFSRLVLGVVQSQPFQKRAKKRSPT